MYIHQCPHELPFIHVVVNHFIAIDQQPRVSILISLLYYYKNRESVSYIHIYCQEMTKGHLSITLEMLSQSVSNYLRMQKIGIRHTELLRLTFDYDLRYSVPTLTWINSQRKKKQEFLTLSHMYSTSLSPIFYISFSTFLETIFFVCNEASLSDVLDVFLFSWCHANMSGQ